MCRAAHLAVFHARAIKKLPELDEICANLFDPSVKLVAAQLAELMAA